MTQQLDRKQIADRLSPEVTLYNPEKVEDFINQDQDPQGFIEWINGTVGETRKYFEQEPLILELLIDRESPDLTHLTLLIETEKPFHEIGKKLDEFLDEVWYEDLSRFTAKFSVDLAFK